MKKRTVANLNEFMELAAKGFRFEFTSFTDNPYHINDRNIVDMNNKMFNISAIALHSHIVAGNILVIPKIKDQWITLRRDGTYRCHANEEEAKHKAETDGWVAGYALVKVGDTYG